MTDTTPTITPPADQPETLAIPPEVGALLDEASIPGGNLRACPTATSVQLIDPKSGEIVREVQWDRAAEWGRRVLQASLATIPNE